MTLDPTTGSAYIILREHHKVGPPAALSRILLIASDDDHHLNPPAPRVPSPSRQTMPPRLPTPFAQAARCCSAGIAGPASRPQAPGLVSLFAALSLQPSTTTPTPTTTPAQIRNASILASLSDNKGAYNKRIRRGRGPSSGYGKTSGRGHKGQKQHGKVHPWFQGGQTPLIWSHGRHGFINQYDFPQWLLVPASAGADLGPPTAVRPR